MIVLSWRNEQLQVTRFRFDCFGEGQSRWQWVNKEEREFHGQLSDIRSYSIPTTPVCVNDMAEVGVTLISLLGITKPGSIEWRDLKVSPMP